MESSISTNLASTDALSASSSTSMRGE